VVDTTVGWRFINPHMPKEWTISLGATAELVALRYKISREEQDQFAFESQRRAAAAQSLCVFEEEIVPVPVKRGDGSDALFTQDEHVRSDVTLAKLADLKPAFVEQGGTVTAGNASGINDGAAAILVLGATPQGLGGVEPMARVVASAVAGVDPSVMGLGPVTATQKALKRAGINVNDLDLIELNEAFAAQAIACMRDLALDPARVNIYGGGIALGHPLGCTGAKLLTTLIHGLRRTAGRYGLATMCIGVGQGIAVIVERL
jgi:acetyl-CoA acetyltransferase family protein